MNIDFSDYKSLTQNDIISINEIGIECSDGIYVAATEKVE